MSDFVAGVMAAWLRQAWLWMLCGPLEGSGLAFGYCAIMWLLDADE